VCRCDPQLGPGAAVRTKGRFVVTLRAIDKSRASSRFVTRSLVKR